MNKLLLTLLATASLNANAEAWITGNKAGGEIVITDNVCILNGETYNALKQSYARNSSGMSIDGCWYYDNGTVHMVYEDKTKYAYPVSGFRKME